MQKLCSLFIGVCLIYLLLPSTGFSAEFKTSPTLKPNGQKWRIAYVQGGDYKDYMPVTRALVQGLMDLGWMNDKEAPAISAEQGSKGLWEWLSAPGRSKYLEFVNDAFYSSNWDVAVRAQNKADLIKRLNEKKDIDLVLAVGTWAGQDLANSEHSVNTVVFSSSDPLASNIIKSQEDSGRDHIWARIDPNRYERQVALFHDIIGFQKLGIVYEDTPEGRSYCSLDRIEKIAKERGFELVRCFAPQENLNSGEASRGVAQCHEELAQKVDAVYVTHHRGVTDKHMHRIVEPLLKHKIPSFSQASSEEVRYGLLMSISQANFRYVGAFYADTVAKILNGAKPRQLVQVFESPPKIAINLATADAIGYEPPVDIIGAADEIFEEIEEYKND